ncbi:MAG: outer membrane protein transport protein [Candidatus Aminicenantes bacterium]|nr:outer membrane protein transport protein [Candidatus Aminicenantes bacterium]
MKKPLSVLLCLALLPALALANGLNLNSLGSRALAMGGAFVGLADDFSAIYWNPAGMSQFTTKTFGFYGTDIIPRGTYVLEIPTPIGTLTAVDAKSMSKHYLSGMAAYYHPVGEKIVAGIGVYVPAGLGSAWDGDDFVMATLPFMRSYEWSSRIAMVTIAPGLSYKINDMISVGAALNVNYGMFDLKRWAGSYLDVIDLGQFEMSLNGWGLGATFGVLAKPSDMISIGATFRTSTNIKFKGETSIANLALIGPPGTSDVEVEIAWPMWLAAGVAVRPIPNLTVTGDLQWSKWSVVDEIKLSYTDPLWQLFMGMGGQDALPLRWENALQIRFGAEYMVTECLAARAGFYVDPAPAPDQTMNVLLPNYDFNVVTLGVGYSLDSLQLDVGIEYLMGKERDIPYLDTVLDPDYEDAQPGRYGMNIFVPTISVSYKF